MTLLQIRTQLRKDSGRADLVNSDYTDNGMDVKIRAACRWLDLTTDVKESWAQYKYDLASGEYKIDVPNIRSIERVYAYGSDGRVKLDPLTFEEMKEKYTDAMADTDSGAPKYYCSAILNLYYGQNTYANLAAFLLAVAAGTAPFTQDYDEIYFGPAEGYSTVLVAPPVDETYTISIWGRFFSKPLTEETDQNFWSVRYPELLIMAVQRQLEIDSRNTEGVKDWTLAIMEYKTSVEYDLISEQISIGNQMEG